MENLTNYIRQNFLETLTLKESVLSDYELIDSIEKAAKICMESLLNGGKILIAGNGGSAADAQHIAAELVSKLMFDRPALAAIALTTDSSVITAIGNDYGFEKIFERQLFALGSKNDVFIGISTSGNSQNIIRGLQAASSIGMKTISLTGSNDKLKVFSSVCIKIPSTSTQRIQELHIIVGHIICGIIENSFFKIIK